MKIGDLIKHLNNIQMEYGDLELYQNVITIGTYGEIEEVVESYGNYLVPSKIYMLDYETEYYCDYEKDVVKDIVTTINDVSIDTKHPTNAYGVHIGLIL